ncbi:MAG: NADH-quinone oxidoreductase subunit C [Desulfobulbus sp.]|nr:NADH-quinone oxidoreductase subunit C [Desulfobulbus sp.]
MDLVERTQAALAGIFPESAAAATPPAGEGGQEAPPRERGVLAVDPARHGCHFDVLCRPDEVAAVAIVLDREGFFLETISGVDWLDKGQFEVVYDYSRLGGEHCRVMVHALVDRGEPVVPTISDVFPAADWHERETFDFYGIHFQGHPHLIRILLPEDADFHPLRKDYMP